MRKRFYIKRWLEFKPQNYNGKTDIHYLTIANAIYSCLKSEQKFMLLRFVDEDEIVNLCCFITCYYEDVISQTNIWKSFKKLYFEAHKKRLPFYTLGDHYVDEEINGEDISFLIWYYINTIQSEVFINPHNRIFFDIAGQVMDVLDEDYEFAPENQVLKNIFTLNPDEADESYEFYETRSYLQTVFFESYLFYPDIKRRLDDDIFETLMALDEEKPELKLSYIREVTEDYTFNKVSALLALNAKDWAKEVLGPSHANYEAWSNISPKIKGLFQYTSQSDTDVILEHIASGIAFKMTKKSFDLLEDLREDEIIYIGLVKYNEEWWFSGNFTAQPFNAALILDQKNSAEARSEVSLLVDRQDIQSILSQQKQAFLDYNEGSLIAFLKSKDLNPFIENYFEFYNNSLKLTNQKKFEADKRAKREGYFGGIHNSEGWDDAEDLFVLFFNPNSGIEFYDDIINAFPDERNPFFSDESQEDVQHILMSQVCSTEFTNYFIEHYRDRLDYFKVEPYKSYLNDLDFLLKFWKKDNYKTKSTVVLTGKTEINPN